MENQIIEKINPNRLLTLTDIQMMEKSSENIARTLNQ